MCFLPYASCDVNSHYFLVLAFFFFLLSKALGAKLTIYLAAVIGAITATGSVTAFAKLQVFFLSRLVSRVLCHRWAGGELNKFM